MWSLISCSLVTTVVLHKLCVVFTLEKWKWLARPSTMATDHTDAHVQHFRNDIWANLIWGQMSKQRRENEWKKEREREREGGGGRYECSCCPSCGAVHECGARALWQCPWLRSHNLVHHMDSIRVALLERCMTQSFSFAFLHLHRYWRMQRRLAQLFRSRRVP